MDVYAEECSIFDFAKRRQESQFRYLWTAGKESHHGRSLELCDSRSVAHAQHFLFATESQGKVFLLHFE